MRVDFSSQQSGAELQQYLRRARIGRGAAGAVILGLIGFMVVASLPQSDYESRMIDASVSEMQLYAVPPVEEIRDIEPAPTAGSGERTLDEQLRGEAGVIHHG